MTMGKKEKVIEKQKQKNVTSKQEKKKLTKIQKHGANDQSSVTKQKKKKGSKQVEPLHKEWITENLTDPSSHPKLAKFNKKQKLNNNESNPKNLKKEKKSKLTPPSQITQNVHITNPIVIKKQTLDRDDSNQMKNMKKAKTNESMDTESTSNETKKKKKRVRQKKKRTGVEAAAETASATKIAPNAGKFLLINLIKMSLNQNEKSMPVAKLQKKVLKKYCQIKGVEEGPKLIKEFRQSLKLTMGVEVVDDKVKLINQ